MNSLAFVTGAGSGLGRATALEFARKGWRVIAGVRTGADAQSLKREAPEIVPIQIDLSDPANILRAAAEVERLSGPQGLAVLCNAAGYAIYGPIEHTTPEDVVRLFQVLTFGPTQLASALRPALARHRSATGKKSKILNVTSWASMDATPFVGYYAAAKAALLRLTQAQMYEFGHFGIDVIAIVPGLMKTSFVTRASSEIEGAISSLSPEALRDYGAPMRRLARLSATADSNALAAPPSWIARGLVALSGRRRLRPQYNFGVDTWLVVAMNRLLPFWALRRIKVAMFGLEPPSLTAANNRSAHDLQ